MKQFKSISIPCGLLCALLWLGMAAPLAFTSCENEHPELNVTLTSDYSTIINAIKNVNSTLSDKLALIEEAIKNGTVASGEANDLIKKALETMNGTLEDKLAAIEEAIKSQTTSLESKLGLIETALKTGFTDQKTALGEIKTALESIKGSVDGLDGAIDGVVTAIDKVTTAVDGTNTALTGAIAKALDDIFKAIDGLTDYSDILEAIKEAIEKISEELGPGYNFMHLAYYTFNTGRDVPEFISKRDFDTNDGSVVWWTRVFPDYLTGDGDISYRHALKKYDIHPLNLTELAFNIVDKDDKIMTEEDIEAAGLKVKFTFADASLGSQTLPYKDKLGGTYSTYNDLFLDATVFYYAASDMDFIRLKGEIETKEGKVRTRFDTPKASVKYPEEVLDYSTFALVPWVPFKKMTLAKDTYTITLDENKIYAVPLADVTGLSLKDNRPNGVSYDVFKDNGWIIGNVSDFDAEAGTYTAGGNGYISGVSSRQAYGITPIATVTDSGIATELKKIMGVKYSADGVSFADEQNSEGSLMPYFVVDYTSEVQFMGEITIPVTITFESAWQNVSAQFTIVVKGLE